MSRICPKCNTQNKEGNNFCVKCGYTFPMKKHCVKCGAMLPLDSKFCTHCGTQSVSHNTQRVPTNVSIKPSPPTTTPRVPTSNKPIKPKRSPLKPSNRTNSPRSGKSLIIALIVTGCIGVIGGSIWYFLSMQKENRIHRFAESFADKASKNQLISLKSIYPGIEKADSVALKYVVEGIVIREENDVYEIVYNPEVTVWAVPAKDNSFVITDSKGLFAYPDGKRDLAMKTGLWTDHIRDIELADRMKDKDFMNFINRKINGVKSNILSQGPYIYVERDVIVGQDIVNNTDQVIKGEDYTLTIHYSFPYWDYETGEFNSGEGYEVVEGKDIPPHDRVFFDCVGDRMFGGGGESRIYSINIKIPDDELRKRFVTFSGKEYQEYLETKK